MGPPWQSALARERRSALALSPLGFERAAPRSVGVLCAELDSAGATLLACGCADGSLALFDASPSWTSTPALLRLPRGTAHASGCAALAWYPGAAPELLFSGGFDGAVLGWDVATGALALRFPLPGSPPVASLALPASAAAPHGLVAAGTGDGRVVLCDPAAGGATHTLVGHRARVHALAWLPGAEHVLASGAGDGGLRLWDVRRAGCLAELDRHAGEGEGGAPQAHAGPVTCLAAAADGRRLYSHGGDGRVRAWDALSGAHLQLHFPAACTPPAPGGLTTRLGLSRDGEVLYCARGAAAQGLCTATGAPLGPRLAGAHFGAVTACVVHPVTDWVFTAALDGALVAWAPARRDERPGAGDVDAWSDGEGGPSLG